MKVTTLASKEAWKAPDGSKTIWDITLQAEDGKTYMLRTFSEKIAAEGFQGDVETYDKNGKKFAKQVSQAGYGGNRGGGSNYQPRDDEAIRAQWAIGQAVTLYLSVRNAENFPDFAQIEEYAKQLFATVPRVKAGQ